MDVKTFSRLGAIAGAVVLAGCASTSAPSRQAAQGRISIDGAIEARASGFAGYMRQARGIEPAFSGPTAVARALDAGAAFDPKALESGMIAYAAMAALQEPAFVAGVRGSRQPGLAGRLGANVATAGDLPGADAATARANGALFRQGEGLAGRGEAVRKAAYLVQRQAWSRAMVPDARGRLNRVKALSNAGYRTSGADAATLQDALSEGGRRSGAPSPVVARGLAVAALTVLGEDGRARALLNEPRSGMCLRMAKLNLQQCLASAGPHYEDIYCLGQHAMLETAHCVVDASRPARSGQPQLVKASYRP